MKRRLVAMFTAVTLVLSMAGCGGTRPAEEKKDTNTAAVAADDTGGSHRARPGGTGGVRLRPATGAVPPGGAATGAHG